LPPRCCSPAHNPPAANTRRGQHLHQHTPDLHRARHRSSNPTVGSNSCARMDYACEAVAVAINVSACGWLLGGGGAQETRGKTAHCIRRVCLEAGGPRAGVARSLLADVFSADTVAVRHLLGPRGPALAASR
jgi:hypothetical protein